MAVINITIEESTVQIVSGIPKTVTLSANIPSTIFYTLDGSTPTTLSLVAIGPITLPTIQPTVTLKIFATNGTDTSPIITKTYNPDFSTARRPHDKVIGLSPQLIAPKDLFPFGGHGDSEPFQYGNSGGLTVDDPNIAGIPQDFDGTATGTPAFETDEPLESYEIEFSTTDKQGRTGRGIGTLPAEVTIIVPPQEPQSSSTEDKLFNPKAMVIYQDGTKEPEDPDLNLINRPYFNLENPEKARDGTLFNTQAINGAIPHGSFLRPHFNPRDNTYTFYYRDSLTNRWIISKEPYNPQNSDVGALYRVLMPIRKNNEGIGKVFQWRPFARRVLDAG